MMEEPAARPLRIGGWDGSRIAGSLLLALALSALLGTLMWGAGSPSSPQSGPLMTQPLQTGEALYRAACAACHGSDGRGAPRERVGFDIPLPDFTACMACHNGLTDASGQDVSFGFDWRATMMANSARDPYWHAAVRREAIDHPLAAEAIENECAACPCRWLALKPTAPVIPGPSSPICRSVRARAPWTDLQPTASRVRCVTRSKRRTLAKGRASWAAFLSTRLCRWESVRSSAGLTSTGGGLR
ncbi:MAG TPA: c-type cytochrome [Acidobacteriota bacterium]|nr:c-type cytochrome [Acidobacteriota bacterium]